MHRQVGRGESEDQGPVRGGGDEKEVVEVEELDRKWQGRGESVGGGKRHWRRGVGRKGQRMTWSNGGEMNGGGE